MGLSQAKRILVYRLGSLGDHVVTLPCYHLLARAYPKAERRMLTNYPVSVKAPAAAVVLGESGLIHSYMRYVVGTRSPTELARLWWAIVRWRPDAVVYLAASRGEKAIRRDAWFFRVCGVRRIIGLPVTEELREPQWMENDGGGYEYESCRLARRLTELGNAQLDDKASWDLHLTEDERRVAREALGELVGKPFFAVSVGTKVQSKDWGRENWRALLGRIAQEYSGYGLALAGAPEESEASEFAADGWREAGGGTVVNLCGKLTPRQSAAAFAQAVLFVGHDSGPMHLAATVGTRCVAIFAARNRPREWFPYGAGHRVLFHKTSCWNCGLETCIVEKKRCITSITVGEVLVELGHAVRDDAPPQTWYQIRETVG
jgi:heptosyltransferase III